MKTRVYPKNAECPLSEKEEDQLDMILESLEWEVYTPLRHLTSSYANATVTEYDEFEIEVKMEYGSDANGSHYIGEATIKRSDFSLLI